MTNVICYLSFQLKDNLSLFSTPLVLSKTKANASLKNTCSVSMLTEGLSASEPSTYSTQNKINIAALSLTFDHRLNAYINQNEKLNSKPHI